MVFVFFLYILQCTVHYHIPYQSFKLGFARSSGFIGMLMVCGTISRKVSKKHIYNSIQEETSEIQIWIFESIVKAHYIDSNLLRMLK